jgi:tungstate transport system substrate-binding protein
MKKSFYSRLSSMILVLAFLLAACAPAAVAPAMPTDVPQAAPTDAPPTAPPVAPTVAEVPPTEAPTSAPAVKPTVAPTAMPTADRSNTGELILATTTSTRDSGLLDVLIPEFEKQTGLTVKVIAVGSGQALQMGKEGNADVLLVHSPKSEVEYMDGGFGTERFLVMHNDYIIVGPASDPAKIKGIKTSAEAFKLIADAKAGFISRGDSSGTHTKEKDLWKTATITPTKDDAWYLESGQGMGDTLRIASEKESYTLSDRATYLSQKDTLSLDILVEGEKSLLNIYHVITVNPEKWPLVSKDAAKAFADFMVAPETQKMISEYGKEKYGQPLFVADAGKNEDEIGK